MKYAIANIQLLVAVPEDADVEAYTADAVSALLSQNPDLPDWLLDWQYSTTPGVEIASFKRALNTFPDFCTKVEKKCSP